MIERRGLPLVAGLVAVSLLLFAFRADLPEPRRFVLALAAIGFFFAPLSERPLRLALWLPAVAAVAWAGRLAGTGEGGLYLWLACSVAGALLAVRGGGRAALYYLPEASGEEGASLRSTIRRQLRGAVVLYLAVYVADGSRLAAAEPYQLGRAVALFLAATLLLRYFLLQSKFLGIPAVPLARPRGIVPAQRWPLLAAMALLGGTRLAERLPGPVEGPLLVSSALLFVLAGLVFALGLTRGSWPRSFVRRASFFAGMFLAVALAAVLVELEGWAPRRFAVFSAAVSFFLVVLPFAARTTRLLDGLPHAGALAPPPVLGVMLSPVTALNGPRWSLPSSGLLFALAVLVLLYWCLVAFRAGGPLRVYLPASLAVLLLLFSGEGTAWAESGSAWQTFLLALGCALYAVDFFERRRVAASKAP